MLMPVLLGENLGSFSGQRGSGWFRSGNIEKWRSGERDAVPVVGV